MSLEHFEVKGNIIHPLLAVGFVNFILTIEVLVMSTTIFARPSGVQMEFPSFREGANSSLQGTSAEAQEAVIVVTSENVIYVNSHVVTLNELRHFLAQGNFYKEVLMVKVDPRASMGRVADILDLCRGIPGASVNVSTIL